MRRWYRWRRYLAQACRASGSARARVAIDSRSLRARAIELPDLQRWTGTLQRVVDPGVGVVQERIDPRLFGAQVSQATGQLGAARAQLDRARAARQAAGLVLERTRIGIVAQAVIMNEELAQSLGINTRLVRFTTFGLGAGLAALSGALLTPLISVHPYLGVPWLINAFMLVLVAGVSLANLALAALVLGGAQVLVSSYGNPVLGSLTIVILAVVILRFRTITI